VVTATAPEGFPSSMPTPSGSATANEFRSAIQKLLILDLSSRVIASQSALAVRDLSGNGLDNQNIQGPWTVNTSNSRHLDIDGSGGPGKEG
jgi:hypothetical protein